jgi:carbonic anhydrase
MLNNFNNIKQIIMKAHTKETQEKMTPQEALNTLKEGNQRFQNNIKANRNLSEQVSDTSSGQYPFATILSCIDSRVSSELIFDQGIGDIFSARVAGNFVNEDILGSMEFACKLAGTKAIVVLGHTACGAIKGACDDAKLGNLTGLLNKLKPAVNAVLEPKEASLRNSSNMNFVNEVSNKNVHMTIDNIRNQSPILKEMEDKGEITIVGAMYDIADGSVTFY